MPHPTGLQRVDRAKMLAQLLVGSPKQEEIDAIAHFVEAVQELRSSPFFIEEFRKLGIRFRVGASKGEIQGQFSSPDVVSGMLIPFRRLWQKGEPCFYHRVANLLKRYVPQQIGWIDSFVFSDKTCALSKWPLLTPQILPPSDVIDLWLNTRYMHAGMSRRRGKFTRKDFEYHEKRMGKALFEYYFQAAVHDVAVSFFNLGRCCEGFLLACEGHGLRPSFALRQHTREGTNGTERATPGLTLRGDSRPDRVWRLKRRERHKALSEFLSLVDISDERLGVEIARAEQFEELVKSLKVRLECREEIALQNNESIIYLSAVADAQHAVWQNKGVRKGFIAKAVDGLICWGGECIGILRDQYLEFREALLRQPFE